MAFWNFFPVWRQMASSKLITRNERRIQTNTHLEDSDFNPSDHNDTAALGDSNAPPPSLFHKIKNSKSILAVAVSESHIYAGSQGGDLLVRG
jgi:di- and tripeptidase